METSDELHALRESLRLTNYKLERLKHLCNPAQLLQWHAILQEENIHSTPASLEIKELENLRATLRAENVDPEQLAYHISKNQLKLFNSPPAGEGSPRYYNRS